MLVNDLEYVTGKIVVEAILRSNILKESEECLQDGDFLSSVAALSQVVRVHHNGAHDLDEPALLEDVVEEHLLTGFLHSDLVQNSYEVDKYGTFLGVVVVDGLQE